jgi:hypothetical protein
MELLVLSLSQEDISSDTTGDTCNAVAAASQLLQLPRLMSELLRADAQVNGVSYSKA